jgi:anaerobic selenocysteine-containing dehydrogenase
MRLALRRMVHSGLFPVLFRQVWEPCMASSRVFLVWGSNPVASNPDGFLGSWLLYCMALGSRLVVVDPRTPGSRARPMFTSD